MKTIKAIAIILAAVVLSAFSWKTPVYKDASQPVEKRVQDLLKRMTLQEKIMQMNQYIIGRNDNSNNRGKVVAKIPPEIGSLIYFYEDPETRNDIQKRAMEQTRLGIPVLLGFDVIHGYRTVFPVPLAQAASFNPGMTSKLNAIAASEAYNAGIDWTFAPMIDVCRDPRWGRIVECYGEDPYTNSVFCEAAVKGFQGKNLSDKGTIAACLKHFVCYGASEAGRDYVYTEVSDQTMWDTYLPPYEAGVKAGAQTVMSAFNNINGIPASANRHTLTDILKNGWGFDGLVVSDWDAIAQIKLNGMAQDAAECAELSVNAGVDLDMKDNAYAEHLEQLVKEGKVSIKRIDDAVARILRVKFRLGLFDDPYRENKPQEEVFMQQESLELSEKAAAESMVLLKNDSSVLPLRKGAHIALIGPLAEAKKDLLGSWRGKGRADETETLAAAMQREFDGRVTVVEGCSFKGEDRSGFAEALQAAQSADAVVLALGEKSGWSGENASRANIELPEIQQELLREVKKAGKPMVVVLFNGRPLVLTKDEPMADAILEAWFPGTRGAAAVAGTLSGRYNPSGKLPVTFPAHQGQIPIYYNKRLPARRGNQGYYFDVTVKPLYPFGHGLSYSNFESSPVTLSADRLSKGGKITASVTVKNTSAVDGAQTVLWFISDPSCRRVTRPEKELRHFEKKIIPAGASETFTFEIQPERDLSFPDSQGKRFIEAGKFIVSACGTQAEFTLE